MREPDIYTWEAVYSDGSTLPQYNGDGTKNKYADIDRSKLKQFHLLKDDKPILIVHLDENKRLIWRMRVALSVFSDRKERVHIVGWQENRNGVNIQSLNFVFEDGHIEAVDKFREDHPWFYSVKFTEAEKI